MMHCLLQACLDESSGFFEYILTLVLSCCCCVYYQHAETTNYSVVRSSCENETKVIDSMVDATHAKCLVSCDLDLCSSRPDCHILIVKLIVCHL